MKSRRTSCPACSAPVEFSVASAPVTICEFCQSVVARVDRSVEDYGKVSDLVETNTPLALRTTGKYKGRRFEVVGRIQYDHPAGGVWNEWYLAFRNGNWGWLAEAQGQFTLFVRKTLQKESVAKLPDFESIKAGQEIKLLRKTFVVKEKGVAKVRSAEGDIPKVFRGGEEHRFVDLTGDSNSFATLEFGENPCVYIGRMMTLEELSLQAIPVDQLAEAISVESAKLSCPHCAGPLELHAPNEAMRMTCQNCNSILNVDQGRLSYLKTLTTRQKMPIRIPLGKVGIFNGKQYTVIGYLGRFAMYAGTTYPWSEYLLYNKDVGFRWLVENDCHWSFVEPVTSRIPLFGDTTQLDGVQYKIYDRGTAYVRHVVGEFYWRVEAGQTSYTADFISPPHMISVERSDLEKSEEINVSKGTYVPVEEIERIFSLKNMRRPWGIGVIQPAPKPGAKLFLAWGAFIMLILGIQFVANALLNRGTDGELLLIAVVMVSVIPGGTLFYLHYFETKRWENSDYSPYSSE